MNKLYYPVNTHMMSYSFMSCIFNPPPLWDSDGASFHLLHFQSCMCMLTAPSDAFPVETSVPEIDDFICRIIYIL